MTELKEGDIIKLMVHYDDEPGFCVVENKIIKVNTDTVLPTVVLEDLDPEGAGEITLTRAQVERMRTDESIGHHG